MDREPIFRKKTAIAYLVECEPLHMIENGTQPARLALNTVGPVEMPATCTRPERMASTCAA